MVEGRAVKAKHRWLVCLTAASFVFRAAGALPSWWISFSILPAGRSCLRCMSIAREPISRIACSDAATSFDSPPRETVASNSSSFGTVGELQQKHLLALNLRRCGNGVAPRSYVVSSAASDLYGGGGAAAIAALTTGGNDTELQAFHADFRVSLAASVLLAAERSSHPPDAKELKSAMQICRDYLASTATCAKEAMNPKKGHAASSPSRDTLRNEAIAMVEQLRALAPQLQLGLLWRNVWIIKPVTGAMGKGISFIRDSHWIRSEFSPLDHGMGSMQGVEVAKACRNRDAGAPEMSPLWCNRKRDSCALGYIIQKYIERPHVLDVELLSQTRAAPVNSDAHTPCNFEGKRLSTFESSRPTSAATDSGWTLEPVSGSNVVPRLSGKKPNLLPDARPYDQRGPGGGKYKYNVRFWLQVRWSSSHPEAWLYESGYIELAAREYTDDLSQESAHITNLSPPAQGRGEGGHGAGSRPCHGLDRQWATEVYQRYLMEAGRPDAEHQLGLELLDRVESLCARALATICIAKPGGGGGVGATAGGGSSPEGVVWRGGGRWKRFGVDFAVDATGCMWLIEFNCNPGMRAARGARGETKRLLVRRFCQDEDLLRRMRSETIAIAHQPAPRGRKESEDIGSAVSGGGCGNRCFGFRRLDVAGWT